MYPFEITCTIKHGGWLQFPIVLRKYHVTRNNRKCTIAIRSRTVKSMNFAVQYRYATIEFRYALFEVIYLILLHDIPFKST